MPRRGPEAGFHRIHYDFHGSGVNHTDSCQFLQSKKILIISVSRPLFRCSPAGVEIIPDQVIFPFFHQAADLSKFRGYNLPEGCGNLMLLHYPNRTVKKNISFTYFPSRAGMRWVSSAQSLPMAFLISTFTPEKTGAGISICQVRVTFSRSSFPIKG